MKRVFSFESPRHLILRYEDLVKDPTATLQIIMNYIEARFDPGMLEKYQLQTATRNPDSMNQSRVFQAIGQSAVARWIRAEHITRVAEFLAHPEAAILNCKAGYHIQRNSRYECKR